MKVNELISSYKKDNKKSPIERDWFKSLKGCNLNISNEELCEILKAKTGFNWNYKVCLDDKFGPGPDNHPMPLCYDLILIAENNKTRKQFPLLHSYYSYAGDVIESTLYKMIVSKNQAEEDKLKNANWAELFLNAENRNGTLYCGEWMKEPLPHIVQECLTEFMLCAANQMESEANSSAEGESEGEIE